MSVSKMLPLPLGFGSMEEWHNHLARKKEEIDRAAERGLIMQICHPLFDRGNSRFEGRDIWRHKEYPEWDLTGYTYDPYVPEGWGYLFDKLPPMLGEAPEMSINFKTSVATEKEKKKKWRKVPKKETTLLFSTSHRK